ncbi:MAG: CHAT domain-containing protein [Planctomycetota bacterium]
MSHCEIYFARLCRGDSLTIPETTVAPSGRGALASDGGRLGIAGFWALIAMFLLGGSTAQAQSRSIPHEGHYDSFGPYLDGDFVEAGRAFESTPYFKSSGGVWIDSIAYHTMLGECLYQMGNLDGALQRYNTALQVFLQYPDWLSSINIPSTLNPSARAGRGGPTWGRSSRAVRVAKIPNRMAMTMGKSDEANARAIEEGGIVQRRYMLMVNAKEIVRCTALAIRRRAEILGPAGEHDNLTSQLVTQLSRRPAPPASWAQAWIGVQLGLAYACQGKTTEAVDELKNSLVVGGMDHNLTSTALLELGKLAFQAEDYAAAGTFFFEATHSAAMMVDEDITQYEIVAEAFRGGMISHLLTDPGSMSEPLLAALEWARNERQTIVEASLLLSAAENAAALNAPARARPYLERAGQVMRRRECLNGELGGRLQFLKAQISFQAGDSQQGSTALSNALAFERKASRRMFQIKYARNLDASGSLSTRQAGLLYTKVLREPTPHDWAESPVETLTVLTTPHAPAFERWMMIALDRKETDKALRISEALRRHRFYTSLSLGGRILNLRWALEAPSELLPEDAALQRQEFRDRYPSFAKLSQQVGQMRARLSELPVNDDDPDVRKQITELQRGIQNAGSSMERILHAMALSREASEPLFPPSIDATTVQEKLTPDQRVIVYVSTSGSTFAFMLGPENYTSWKLRSPGRLRRNISKMLRDMGHFDRNQPLGLKELSSDTWKATSADLLQELTAKAPAAAWDEFEELIIVPDGILWYLPFEALQIQNEEDESMAVIDKVRVRYAPTISLAVPDERPRPRVTRTAVVTGSLFPESEKERSQQLLEDLKEDDPNVFGLSVKPPSATAVLAKTIGRLVVLNDLTNLSQSPYGWAPMPVAEGGGGSLARWMQLPWGGPDQLVLPGFHTSAESALKGSGTGQEMFLTACGLMATGSRTVLLSRWRDGGLISHELIQDFVQELPYRSASSAWQRAVRLAVTRKLAWLHEPRVKELPSDAPTLKADHPFFWSGYMLLDTGVEPK